MIASVAAHHRWTPRVWRVWPTVKAASSDLTEAVGVVAVEDGRRLNDAYQVWDAAACGVPGSSLTH